MHVSDKIDLPFLPSPIVPFALRQLNEKCSSEHLLKNTLEQLEEILDAEGTQSTLDDVDAT